MGMTQAELLGSLGAECLLGDQRGMLAAVERRAVRITGEVCRGTPADPVTARITYQDATRPAPHMACGLTAEPHGGKYVVTGFEVGGHPYFRDGGWVLFSEVDACAFVRAVMLELQARRLPDLDALLTVATMNSGTAISVDWE